MQRDSLRQFLTIAAFIATLVVNGIASAVGLNGRSTGEIAEQFDVFFLPASYVFAIWGVIYLGLLAYVIFQALPRQKRNPVLRAIAPWFIVSSLANLGWLLLWHYNFYVWSQVLMVVLLISLLAIYWLLGTGRLAAPPAEKRFVRLPFSIYTAWITVATVANATAVLASLNWDGWGLPPEVWTVIVSGVATLIAVVMRLRHSDRVFVLVVIWALAGIVVRFSDVLTVALPLGFLSALLVVALFIDAPRYALETRFG